MERIVQGATALGFKAVAHQRIVKHARPVLETEILSIEALEEAGPDDWRALRALLRANLPRATWRIAPLQLQLEPVHRWLDDQYGEGAWSYDSNHTLTKIITTSDGNAMPFRLFRWLRARPRPSRRKRLGSAGWEARNRSRGWRIACSAL